MFSFASFLGGPTIGFPSPCPISLIYLPNRLTFKCISFFLSGKRYCIGFKVRKYFPTVSWDIPKNIELFAQHIAWRGRRLQFIAAK